MIVHIYIYIHTHIIEKIIYLVNQIIIYWLVISQSCKQFNNGVRQNGFCKKQGRYELQGNVHIYMGVG